MIDPFESLCSGIMSQQVSGAAAKSIKNKFIGLFQRTPDDPEFTLSSGKAFPKPSQIVTCSIPFLRTAGLSERKAEYIKGLAEKFHCGDLSAKMLMKASDEEVLEKLVSPSSLGPIEPPGDPVWPICPKSQGLSFSEGRLSSSTSCNRIQS